MKDMKAVSAALAAIACLAAATPGLAITLGSNVTISDGAVSTYGPAWWTTANEDNEVEPDIWTMNQTWDLEGFFLNGADLTLVGGYSFQNATGHHVLGDIFIDVTGDAGRGGSASNYGYEYVMDLNFASLTYSIYELGPGSTFLQPVVRPASGPWQRLGGGNLLAADVPMLSYWDNLPGSEVGGLRDDGYTLTHSAFVVNVGWLSGMGTATTHVTMNCGNDAARGRFQVVPDGGSSIVLLGLAICGVAFVQRRRNASGDR